jgi:hypothetical protein
MTTTATPFAALAAGGDDSYDLSVWMHVIVNRYPGGVVAAELGVSRDYCIEAGRNHGAWSLRVSPWNGEMEGDDVLTGPPLVALRDQIEGADPLARLRALLTGRQA